MRRLIPPTPEESAAIYFRRSIAVTIRAKGWKYGFQREKSARKVASYKAAISAIELCMIPMKRINNHCGRCGHLVEKKKHQYCPYCGQLQVVEKQVRKKRKRNVAIPNNDPKGV